MRAGHGSTGSEVSATKKPTFSTTFVNTTEQASHASNDASMRPWAVENLRPDHTQAIASTPM